MRRDIEIQPDLTNVQSKMTQYKKNEALNNKGKLVNKVYEIPSGTRGYLIEKKDKLNQIRGYTVVFAKPLAISKHVYIYRQNFKTINDLYNVYEVVITL